MTDFTHETRCVCASCLSYSTRVEASKGGGSYAVTFSEANPGEYSRNWHCECPGFSYRGKCKHVEQVKAEVCFGGEDAFAGGPGLGEVEACPHCGGPVTFITIAV